MNVSIIIATKNRGHVLSKCLTRLCRQLGEHDEVIVVDNASTDHTPQVVGRFTNTFPVVYLREDRNGASWARNTGFAHATGDGVAFIDDDSLVTPLWLSRIKDTLSRNRKLYPRAVYQGSIVQKYLENEVHAKLQRSRFRRDMSLLGMDPSAKPNTRLRTLIACNIFSYRHVLSHYQGPFNAALFPFVGEQFDLACRLIQTRVPILYAPNVQVIHTKQRAPLTTQLQSAFAYGKTMAILQRLYFSDHTFALSYHILGRQHQGVPKRHAYRYFKRVRPIHQVYWYAFMIDSAYWLGFVLSTGVTRLRLGHFPFPF